MLKPVVVGIVSLVWSASVGAETLTVCLDGSCDHTTVQAAIDAATNVHVIEVSGELYLLGATVVTNGEALTIQGAFDSFQICRIIVS